MTPHKLEYRSAGQPKVRQPGELASAIVGVVIFAVPFLVACTLLVQLSPEREMWMLFLMFAIVTGLGTWRFAARIWGLCRRDG